MLQGRAWMSLQKKPKGIIHLLHGLGEHSARYATVGDAFADAGYHFFGFDLRGHGLSGGKRGHTPNFSHFMNDIENFIRVTEDNLGSPDLPKIIYGHGYGGNLAVNYVLRRQPITSATIISSPTFDFINKTTKIKRIVIIAIATLFPTFQFRYHYDVNAISRDRAIVKAYQDDVYNHNNYSAQLGLAIKKSGNYALNNAHKWDLPMLLMHGTADRISPPSTSQTFAKKAGDIVDLVLWDGYYHELHNDIGREKVINKMIHWLDREIK